VAVGVHRQADLRMPEHLHQHARRRTLHKEAWWQWKDRNAFTRFEGCPNGGREAGLVPSTTSNASIPSIAEYHTDAAAA
jgi:hypothetical protein